MAYGLLHLHLVLGASPSDADRDTQDPIQLQAAPTWCS